jgi:hypothetical protein
MHIEIANKSCRNCGETKALTEFSGDRGKRDGRTAVCRPCAAKKTSLWRSANRERHRIYSRNWLEKNSAKRSDWKIANKHVLIALIAKRRAAKAQATPKWADAKKIYEFYREAKLAGKQVDHIVPLLSATVCGLHNEFNLQVLSAKENLAKSNQFWPDMPNG